MRIVVVGGQGDLGARVVERALAAGHDVASASRRTGVDLRTGAGLTQALAGADAVVLCAMNPTRAAAVELEGTRRILTALDAGSGSPAHVVYISIVGCDVPGYPYYGVKHRTEQVLEAWGGPATVVRATQFHALAAFFAGFRVGRLGARVGDMAIQPVDIEFVAQRLSEVASGPAPQRFTHDRPRRTRPLGSAGDRCDGGRARWSSAAAPGADPTGGRGHAFLLRSQQRADRGGGHRRRALRRLARRPAPATAPRDAPRQVTAF